MKSQQSGMNYPTIIKKFCKGGGLSVDRITLLFKPKGSKFLQKLVEDVRLHMKTVYDLKAIKIL